jgi:hypothetical protein
MIVCLWGRRERLGLYELCGLTLMTAWSSWQAGTEQNSQRMLVRTLDAEALHCREANEDGELIWPAWGDKH